MGIGDNIMATGMARGAAARGKRIAFGDGLAIKWDQNSSEVFKNNPNIAPPGAERSPHIEWVRFYKGHRIYNDHDRANHRWIWNMEFRPTPGEFFFDDVENNAGRAQPRGFVLIEPNVPAWKTCAPNKQWPVAWYREIAERLTRDGLRVLQFSFGGMSIVPAAQVKTRLFRHAVAILRQAALYIGPEGGMHHGAAAVGVRAVVIFGGFIPPQVTGYDLHTNLAGADEFCGSLRPCEHCRRAMERISVEEVYAAAVAQLERRAA